MKNQRKSADYIDDILNEIKKVNIFIGEMTFDQFVKEEKTAYAVIRAIEIIGEASKKIPDDIKHKQPGLPWREISGMRDKLIHDYFGINLTIVWKTIKEDFPIIEPLLHELAKEPKESFIVTRKIPK
jgi:uncharacterized protein with HEPN domain